MRFLRSSGPWIVLLICVAAAGLIGSDSGKAGTDQIAPLIEQLGDDKFANREAASRGLRILGEQALPALRNAAVASRDLETRKRARQLIRGIMVGVGTSKSTGLKMVLIDEAEFEMGSPNPEANRRADEFQHRVRITRPFLLGATEVTQGEYQQVMKTNPSWFANTGGGKDKAEGNDTSRFPVENVTWFDAIEFCNRLSQQDGFEPFYKLADVKSEADSIKSASVTVAGGNGYRLPTEAEWELACRAGTSGPFHFGSQNTGREANLKPGPSPLP